MPDLPTMFGQEPSLADYLVFGRIIWAKGLGLPEGRIEDAFDIACNSYQYIGPGSPDDPRSWVFPVPHATQASEGAHDDGFYRVNILTSSEEGKDFDPADPLAHRNVLTVSFRKGVKWAVPPLLRAWAVRTITPATTFFQASKPWQTLPDVQVVMEPLPPPHVGG